MAHSLYHSSPINQRSTLSVDDRPTVGRAHDRQPLRRAELPRPPCARRGARSSSSVTMLVAVFVLLAGLGGRPASASQAEPAITHGSGGARRLAPATRCGRSPRRTTATSGIDRYVDALIESERWHRRADRSGDPAAVSPSHACDSCNAGQGCSAAANRYRQGVQCPICHADDTKVVDSRVAEEATAIRRRRECLTCAHRFTTFERVDHAPLTVVKSHGGREPFDRKKVVSGLLRGHDRPIRRARTARGAGVPGRGIGAAAGLRGVERQRRPGRARGAAHARRGGLPALRQRVQGLRRGVRLPS